MSGYIEDLPCSRFRCSECGMRFTWTGSSEQTYGHALDYMSMLGWSVEPDSVLCEDCNESK